MKSQHAAVQEFWAFLKAELAKAEDPYLPQLVAVLIDDYRHLAPLILRDAERDPARKAMLDRAKAVSVAMPLRWGDGIRNMQWWMSDVEALDMDEPYTEQKKEGDLPF